MAALVIIPASHPSLDLPLLESAINAMAPHDTVIVSDERGAYEELVLNPPRAVRWIHRPDLLHGTRDRLVRYVVQDATNGCERQPVFLVTMQRRNSAGGARA